MTDAEFIIYLKQKFNVQNFFFCFQYMKDYVDFDGSSDRGRWYMQSIPGVGFLRVKQWARDECYGIVTKRTSYDKQKPPEPRKRE